MKKFLSSSLQLLLIATLLTSTLILPGQSKILDPKARHTLLRAMASDLHRDGIDVVQNWRSNIPASTRPIVAPLANYQISLAPKDEQWIREFNSGATGALAAIKSDENLDGNAFTQIWKGTPKRRRIFLSFAREDVTVARKVKAALEKQGYVAFIYLNKQGQPAQAPALVGEYLRTAGTHLVLDTVTARRKTGVLAEALAYAGYRRPPPPDVDPPSRNGKPSNTGWPTGSDETALSSRRPVVEIYGAKKRCPRTRQAIQIFEDAGADVRYYDVDRYPRARSVVNKNTKWLEKGDLLPFIRVDGKPIKATSAGVQACLTRLSSQ